MPGGVVAARGAHLRDDHEILGIGMQRLADDLVGDMRAVEVAGVDVVDAGRDRLAQDGDRRVAILGRAEHAGAGELHGAVAHAAQGEVVGNCQTSAGCGGRHDCVLSSSAVGVNLDVYWRCSISCAGGFGN